MVRDRWGTKAADFHWAVGIENTFIPHTRAGHRRLDEYELLDHYRLWKDDLDLAADLGISAIRYGIPWYRVNPRPGVFDWSWTDAVLEHLVTVRGLVPIIDLMHYGTPLWLDNHFVNASYARRVADYAYAFAERYRSLVKFYTPLNEPGVTAAFCGRDGRWPPYLSGDDGYVKVLLALAKGMALTGEALRSVRHDMQLVHVEDVGLELPGSDDLAEAASHAQARRLLPLDLACGRVVSGHPGHDWLIEHGASEAELADLAARMPRWDVLGVNFYPWSTRILKRRRSGAIASTPDRAGEGLGAVIRLVGDRYGLPLMITETSSPGGHLERARWMVDTLSAIRAERASGRPIVGYTWFPMFTMVEWKYRWSRKAMDQHLLHLGLWDVTPHAGRLDREATPLVGTYRDFVSNPVASIGECGASPVALPLAGQVA